MSTQARTISTTAHVVLTDAAGQESSVYRVLLLVETREGGWLIKVGEPDSLQDDPEGELVASGMTSVPEEAAAVFNSLFSLIADPATAGARTR